MRARAHGGHGPQEVIVAGRAGGQQARRLLEQAGLQRLPRGAEEGAAQSAAQQGQMRPMHGSDGPTRPQHSLQSTRRAGVQTLLSRAVRVAQQQRLHSC